MEHFTEIASPDAAWLVLLTKVSVIVTTYSEERIDMLMECLHSLNGQSLVPHEIILVLEEELAYSYASRIAKAIVVVSPAKGLSNSRNAGIKAASGDIVAFIDDDAVADENWLRNLVKNYGNRLVLGVGGLIVPVWENGRPIWFPEEFDWIVGCSYEGLPNHKSFVRNPIGCNMSFRRNVFAKCGYFATSIGRFGRKLVGSEEAEFCLRLLRELPGARITYDPSAVVYHKVPINRSRFGYFVRRSYYEGVSKGLIEKIQSRRTRTLSLERNFLGHLLKDRIPLRLNRILKTGNFPKLMAIVAAIGFVSTGYMVCHLTHAETWGIVPEHHETQVRELTTNLI